jgi:hypothetical protein
VSRQEEQLREFKRLVQVQEAAVMAQCKGDRSFNLMSSVSAEFDDYIAFQKLYEKEAKNLGGWQRFKTIAVWLFTIPKLLNFGPPCTDPITRNFIEDLGKNGVITRAQVRLLNVYKIIRLDPSGSCILTLPSCKDYSRAKLMVGILLMLTPLLALVVWEVASCILPGLPFGFLMGATLGLLWRSAYNLAWGREKLARYISSRYPWFKSTIGLVAE